MNTNKIPTQQDDEVSALIDDMYDQLMVLRFEYMDLRKKGSKDKAYLDTLLEKIINMNEDFENIMKSHSLYLRFKKATGHGKATHSSELLSKIQELRSNVGQIVSMIPKAS